MKKWRKHSRHKIITALKVRIQLELEPDIFSFGPARVLDNGLKPCLGLFTQSQGRELPKLYLITSW